MDSDEIDSGSASDEDLFTLLKVKPVYARRKLCTTNTNYDSQYRNTDQDPHRKLFRKFATDNTTDTYARGGSDNDTDDDNLIVRPRRKSRSRSPIRKHGLTNLSPLRKELRHTNPSQVGRKHRMDDENDIMAGLINAPSLFKNIEQEKDKIDRHAKFSNMYEEERKSNEERKNVLEEQKLSILRELNDESELENHGNEKCKEIEKEEKGKAEKENEGVKGKGKGKADGIENVAGYDPSKRRKYLIDRDSEYLERLVKLDNKFDFGVGDGSGSGGIYRHFYCLKQIDNLCISKEFEQGLPRSLMFHIAGDKNNAYELILGGKNGDTSTLKGITLQALHMVNPNYLLVVTEMIEKYGQNSAESSPKSITTYKEFEKYTLAVGVQPHSLRSPSGNKSLCVKIEQHNDSVNLQLHRLNLLFTSFLIEYPQITKQDLDSALWMFFLIISDYNANKQEYLTLQMFIKSIFPKFTRIWTKDELVSKINTMLQSIQTAKRNEVREQTMNKKHHRRIDYELQYNILRLLNTAFSSLSTTVTTSVIMMTPAECDKLKSTLNELNILFISLNNTAEDRTIHPAPNPFKLPQLIKSMQITGEIKSRLQSRDVEFVNEIFLYYFKIKLLPFVVYKNSLDFSLDRKHNIHRLRNYKDALNALVLNCYKLMGTINTEIYSQYKLCFDGEEVVLLLTDIHQDLSLLGDKVDTDLKALGEGDLFYDDLR